MGRGGGEDDGIGPLRGGAASTAALPAAGTSGFASTEEMIGYAESTLLRAGVQEGEVCIIEAANSGSEYEAARMAFAAAAEDLGVTVKVYPPDATLTDLELAEKLYYQTKMVDGDAAQIQMSSYRPRFSARSAVNLSQEDADRRAQMVADSRRAQAHAQGENIGRWSVGMWPTKEWAQEIYPGLSPDEAQGKLSDCLARATFANDPEGLQEHQQKLRDRADTLTEFETDSFEISNPPPFEPPHPLAGHPLNKGTSLEIGMAEGQHFETCDLENAQGKSMGVNNPSDEVFGTPSARRVSGHMTTTRPFIAEGEVVEGIYMEFEDGKMVKAVSLDPKHQDLVDRYFNDESGTTTMSEVGLVDAQGALAAESHNGQPVIFNNGICDENTGIHIALGHSYLGMTGGKGVSEGGDAADAKGVGTPCHFDLVIGGPGSTVRARNKSGEVMEVITQGSWKM